MNGTTKRADDNLREVSFARQDGVPLEVEVLRLETLLRPPFKPNTTKPTRSRFHTIMFIETGHSSHEIDFERHAVAPGHLLVIPAGQVHAFDRERVITGNMVLFTTAFLERSANRIAGLAAAGEMLLRAGLHLALGGASLARMRRSVTILAEQSGDIAAQRFAQDAITAAFSLLLYTLADLPEVTSAVAARTPHDEVVSRFLSLLEARHADYRQAGTYAQALHVSPRTLDRRVMSVYGQTARQLISARVILEAKRLLTRREVPIKQIAYELGFPEPQNFTRFFRTQTGISPTAFRQALD